MNRYKNDMSPDELYRHMNSLRQNYNPDADDAVYESYVEGDDVQVTKALRLLALSPFAKS